MSRIHSVLVIVALHLANGSLFTAEPAVRPLPDHPGNIFLAGEEISLALPPGIDAAWKLFDYDDRVAKEGHANNGKAAIGRLPVGYYELRGGTGARVTIGVVAPQAAPTPASSPIGIDVAMAWFYKPPQLAAVANLCRLAGVNYVRDRLAWTAMEPRKGQFAAANIYDETARVQSAAGLRILQVNHSTPEWASPLHNRFPPDLRDAYRFYREMARRWKGQVIAFEPWNEADIAQFGGHTGAEMASLQKSCFLGLKAGNPDVIASLNVFAINRPSTLDDLKANEAWPYFDTCNLHHYCDSDQYPAWYASFREICAGRPMWVSEFNMPIPWSGDATAQEPADADLRKQARRVAMVFAASLHEEPRAVFYFLLPHYVEGRKQFGLLHRDLTPRPAYLAMAAVGRLLADAVPAGRTKPNPSGLRAYLFRAKPDGKPREVMVAWSEKEQPLPLAPEEAFDHLGRTLTVEAGAVKIGPQPMYLVMPVGAAEKVMTLEPPIPMPAIQKGQACPVVLQATWPVDRVRVDHSSYRIAAGKAQNIPVFVYNFSDRPAKGTLRIAAPDGWKVSLAERVDLPAGDRKELALAVEGVPADTSGVVSIRGDFGDLGKAVLRVKLETQK